MKKFPLVIWLLSASCIAPRVSITNTNSSGNLVIDGKTFATAYQQRSAEYKALCYQAFNIAHTRIEEFNRQRSPKPKAIMTDIDETILNNSPYQAHQLLAGKDYDPVSWKEWTSKGEADTLPGALNFLKYAAATGIEIFYVTNRDEEEREGTLKNLKKFNFPNADDEHLLLKGNTSSKEARKNSIAETHTIVLLMGDNMNDFSFLFEKKSSDERKKVADSFAADFGNRLIVLPNPVYGDWESSLYHYNYGLTAAQKDSVIKVSLYSY
ncbi:MAG TPA: 5'-nucleotidase, lipoprotein e(P4) family [Hanamia sp.]|jgi:5'-nucleotidase (lipoprotein e(P4) family)|nr:5'-nucleotidase, lipoprotein e(P4) family [Hanamia sp.]